MGTPRAIQQKNNFKEVNKQKKGTCNSWKAMVWEQGLILYSVQSQDELWIHTWTIVSHCHHGVTPVFAKARSAGSKQGWTSHSGDKFLTGNPEVERQTNFTVRKKNRQPPSKWKNIHENNQMSSTSEDMLYQILLFRMFLFLEESHLAYQTLQLPEENKLLMANSNKT